MIEKYKALEAKYERLKPRHEAYVKMLGELLAVLHADGGHYQYEHGTEKAVEDSITKHYELTRQLAEYKAEAGLRDAVPEGFTLVPNGPTEAMISAAMSRYKHQSDSAAINFMQMHRENFKQDYMAMLAAAPKGEKE